jgi:TRAP-type C4-dicarboxylate transport system permease small subunit
MVGLEVVLRRVFNASLQGADEIGGYVVAVVVAFGAAAALLERAHTRIDIFIAFLPAGARAALNALAALAMAALATFLCLRGIAALRDSLAYGSLSGTPLQTPLWLPQAVWVAGLAFFALVAVGVAAHCAVLLARDREALNRWYGARALSEDLAEEQASVRSRLRAAGDGAGEAGGRGPGGGPR